MATLQLRRVVKRFHETAVIHGVDLEAAEGEFVVFVGPSGCGKSTLLRMICGLEEVSEGDILIDGVRVNEVPPARRGLAMVFQSYALYPHMSVYQNLSFGLENLRLPRAEIDAKVREAARMLRLDQFLERRPTALSGGQRQRVAIGRAIVREPRIFLFDEPLSNLDAELRVQMRGEIAQLHHRLGTNMIYVTHDQVEAMTMADKIVVLRAGRIEQVGAPLELYNAPANQFVAGFIGSPRMNFLEGTPTAVDGSIGVVVEGIGTIRTDASGEGVTEGARVTLGIRPEHVALGRCGCNDVSFDVAQSEQLGNTTTLFFASPGFAVQVAGQVPARRGEAMSLNLPPDRCHVFDADGKALPRQSKGAAA
ncbi:MAG TPA: sn-glycerol-3-phosphate ABC transporter ATP-binding protein UgpC [Stellaceae bacterium]|nr:sn-glycerol-3-phosphate ABC transporter ATP-binding protein UgpC [Stellaceae bacterium]